MNRLENIKKPLSWFMALLLAAVVAGCGGGDGVPAANPPPGTNTSTVLPGVAGTTGANVTNPTVISASPANLATNVATSTDSWTAASGVVSTGTLVTATFNAAMDPATITAAGTFTLKTTTAGTNVPGTVTMNAASSVATFTPTATALTANTQYTATVTTAAKNAIGTAMPKAVAWSFTTNATALTGQAPVNLLTAGDFTVLAQTAITLNSSSTVVVGDMGISPNGSTSVTGSGFTKTQDASLDFWTSPEVVAISGVPASGRIYMSDDTGGGAGSVGTGVTTAKVLQAKLDVIAAYNDAAGRTAATASGTFLNRNGGSLDGQTLVPGVYTWNGASSNVTSSTASSVTLSGGPDDVWIFQIAGYLDPGASSNMILSNPTPGGLPPQAKNIFWAVAGTDVTLLGGAHIEGVVLTGASGYITLNAGATANSRLLSQTAVTVNNGTVRPPLQ
ncbi:MAG: ice-binding family protein [Gallionella sp.]|nr:ice-binding family protein [Gallionella sp.]